MPLGSVRPLPSQQITAFSAAARRYNTALSSDRTAVEYLEGRGLALETAQRFGLGIVTDDEFGAMWQGFICIPNMNARGQVVALKFRAVDPERKPKYGAPTGITQPLFNLRAVGRVRDTLVFTEGEFDALSVEKAGYPCVGVPGAENWKPYYRRMFESIPNIVLFYDDDRAGIGLLETLRRELNVIPVRSPVGKDPNDALVADPTGEILRRTIDNVLAI